MKIDRHPFPVNMVHPRRNNDETDRRDYQINSTSMINKYQKKHKR